MAHLLVISGAPVEKVGDNLRLDVKFVEGMKLYAALWPGSVTAILPQGRDPPPFGASYRVADLPFALRLVKRLVTLGSADLAGTNVILCSGDDAETLHLAALAERTNKRLFYTIENTPKTRHQILFLDSDRSLVRKLYGIGWAARQEHRRRAAFRLAHGLQANGYPAFAQYCSLSQNTLLYLDNRMKFGMFATDGELAARRRALLSGAPLRLLHSGRIEPIKGAHDLVPVALGLRQRGVAFSLAIYGTGSYLPELRQQIEQKGLRDCVQLHDPVDFETQLVPLARRTADLFLSCHRQSDPSCTYLESMGCGLPVAGYANRMLVALIEDSKTGWTVPLGDSSALAAHIARLDRDRAQIADQAYLARDFAYTRAFESEFSRRIEQLAAAI